MSDPTRSDRLPPRIVRISQIFQEARPSSHLVAFGPEGERRFGALVDDVSALAAAIEKVGAGRWLLYTENGYAAAVALLALAQTGSVAVFAPNHQPDTVKGLRDELAGAVVDPGFEGGPLAGCVALSPLSQPPAPPPRWSIDRDAPLVEFRTSGTTRDGAPVPKALRHLEDEVETLESVFGPGVPGDARLFSTVSHQHIYGLLFRVLWPLASGRAFRADVPLHPRELYPHMLESRSAALVTTPAHLRRLTASRDLARVRPRCCAVFSSGSPLEADIALAVAELLGDAPWEILGSTETGGVAIRRRPAEAWTPLPGVSVDREPGGGRLVVTSPFVSVGSAAGPEQRTFTTGDCIELGADGTFALLGRSDRTVKIAGKRLALPEMERDLASHEAVSEVAMLVQRHAAESRVHAVVVLSATGRALLRGEGRRAVRRALSDHLAARWDPVMRPRVWRYVDALPRNAQGKLPLAALEALFAARDRDPILRNESRGARSLERSLEVPADLAYLEGHFPGRPIVAGVVQLRWVVDACFDLLGRSPAIRGFEALKFLEPLLPGQAFTLGVEVSEVGDRVRFRLADGGRVFSTGRCLLDPSMGVEP